jgi:hypothetical protein
MLKISKYTLRKRPVFYSVTDVPVEVKEANIEGSYRNTGVSEESTASIFKVVPSVLKTHTRCFSKTQYLWTRTHGVKFRKIVWPSLQCS